MIRKSYGKKNVLIIGAGERGLYIAHALSAEENLRVTLVDIDPHRLQSVQASLNVVVVVGNGISPVVLEEAGIKYADICIACTDSNETNLVCAIIAEKQYNIKQSIAISSESLRYRSLLNKIKANIEVINMSAITTVASLAIGRIPLATEASSFGENKILLIGYRINKDSPWIEKKIAEVRAEVSQTELIIACIIRDGEVFMPKGEDELKANDYAYIIFLREQLETINSILGVHIESMQKAIVFGHGDTVNQFVSGLLRNHYHVTLICPYQEQLQSIQRYFSHRARFQAIAGDASSIKLQLQREVSRASLFVSAVAEDYVNIGTCIMAKFLGAQKTIAFVNRHDLFETAQSENIDGIISPRLLVAREVKKRIFKTASTINYTTLGETNMEAREIVIVETSPVIGKAIKDLKLPVNCLIGAVIRKESCIPTGDFIIQALDKVVVFTLSEEINTVTRIFDGDNVESKNK